MKTRASLIPHLLIPVFLALLPAASARAEINIEASLNPAKVAVGEPVELMIAITGASGSVQAPKLPELKGFRSYSQGHSEEFSFANGKSSSRTVFTFVLVPAEEGVFTIDAIDVPIDGKTFKTGNLKVEVGPASTAGPPKNAMGKPIARVVPPSSRSLPPDYMGSQEVFIRAWTDREEAYVNQPIYLTYTLYTRTSATLKGFEDEPETTGFWVEDFPTNPQANREERVLSGYRYMVADMRYVALFPTEAGTKRFNPGSLKIDAEIVRDIYGNNPFQQSQNPFFRRRYIPQQLVTEIQPRILETESITFKIKPLPEAGKPADFTGAVGRFKINASIDQNSVEEGHPVTLRVELKGEGNLMMLQLPKAPKIDGFKSYDSSSNLNLVKDKMVVEGTKTLETVFVPRRAGNFTIPSMSFSYFDPAKEQYVTLETKPLPIQVTPAPAGEAPPAPEPSAPEAPSAPFAPAPVPAAPGLEGIRFVKTDPGMPSRVTRPAMASRSFWLLQISALFTALMFLILRLIFERLGINLLGAKPRRFKGEAVKSFRLAKQAAKSGDERQFFEALSRGVYGYFADKLRIDLGGVGTTRVEAALQGKVTEEEMNRIRELFERLDYGRFASAKLTPDEMKQLHGEAERLVNLVEKKRL